MSAHDVDAAFELLIETLAEEKSHVDEDGSRFHRQGDYDSAQKRIGLGRMIEKVSRGVSDLQADWASTDIESNREPDSGHTNPPSENGIALCMNYHRATAQSVYIDGKIFVREGSTIRKDTFSSLPDYLR